MATFIDSGTAKAGAETLKIPKHKPNDLLIVYRRSRGEIDPIPGWENQKFQDRKGIRYQVSWIIDRLGIVEEIDNKNQSVVTVYRGATVGNLSFDDGGSYDPGPMVDTESLASVAQSAMSGIPSVVTSTIFPSARAAVGLAAVAALGLSKSNVASGILGSVKNTISGAVRDAAQVAVAAAAVGAIRASVNGAISLAAGSASAALSNAVGAATSAAASALGSSTSSSTPGVVVPVNESASTPRYLTLPDQTIIPGRAITIVQPGRASFSNNTVLTFDFESRAFFSLNPDARLSVVTRCDTGVITTAARGSGLILGNSVPAFLTTDTEYPPNRRSPSAQLMSWLGGLSEDRRHYLLSGDSFAPVLSDYETYRVRIESYVSDDRTNKTLRFTITDNDAVWYDSGVIVDPNREYDHTMDGLVFGHSRANTGLDWEVRLTNISLERF